jgi:pilus assembly protein FimV
VDLIFTEGRYVIIHWSRWPIRTVWFSLLLACIAAKPVSAMDIRCAEVQANSTIKEYLYGPTRPGESLTTIARPLARKYGVSPFQAQVALWRRNPGQFVQANMNGLKSGCQLVIPAAPEFSKTSSEEAGQLLLSHGTEWKKPYAHRKIMGAHAGAATSTAQRESSGKAFAEERPVQFSPPGEEQTTSRGPESLPLDQISNRLQSIVHLLEKNQNQMDSLMQRVSAMESKHEMFKQFEQRLSVLEGRIK